MDYSRKRSLSPQSKDNGKKRGKFGFGFALLSFFRSSSSADDVPSKSSGSALDNELEIQSTEESLPNDFVSSKKKRLSIMGHPDSQTIPRSSITTANTGLYKNYYNSLMLSNQEANNDVERRMSTVYGPSIMKDGVMNHASTPIKDNSPIQDIENISFQQLSISNRILNDLDNNSDLENDFPPLYQDNEGNLVRPPFINLDPRERYQLLQLKKSIDASESIERKMKYMKDPNETVSSVKGNKVETATQTHDINFLRNSLSFTNKKRKQQSNNSTNPKKLKRKGFYGGDFTYDLDAIESKIKKSSHKLDGYLGSISELKFNKKAENKNSKPAVDELQPFSNFADQAMKSSEQRIGLDSSLLYNKKIDTSLDPEYVSKSEELSKIIKIKETVPNGKKSNQTKPSAGFQFNINKDDVNSILNTRTETKKLLSSTKGETRSKLLFQESSKPIPFGTNASSVEAESKKDDTKISSPAFTFGTTQTEKSNVSTPLFDKNSSKPITTDTKKEGTPKSDLKTLPLFGSEATKPSFSFGTSTTKRRSLQTDDIPSKSLFSKDNEHNKLPSSDRVPTFSFGKQDDKPKTDNPVNKPAFLFGTTSKPSETKSDKPAFLFGSEPKSKETQLPKPVLTPSLGKTSDEPKPFLFSAPPSTSSTLKETDDKENNAAEKKTPTLFGKPETSGLLFGSKPIASSESPKPAFLFGQTSDSSKSGSGTGTLAFGKDASQNDTQSKPKPFSFDPKPSVEQKREAEKPKSAFSFGSTTTPQPEPPKASAFLFGSKPDISSTTPKPFSFNADQASTGKPGFSFGKETTPTGKPSFSFGATASGSSSTPTGLFNSNSNTTPGGSKPAFGSSNIPSNGPEATKPFSFGTPGPSGGSSGTNAAAKPIGNPNFKFAAGVQPVKSFTDTSNAFGGFGNKAGNTGGQFSFGQANNPSRQTTPTSFNFGGPTTTADPASIFGQPASNGTSASANTTFNFGGSNSREATPNPAEVFGGNGMNGFNPMSMPQPQFGTPQGNMFGGTNSTPTPPLQGMPSNRKIAMMRKRRGH